MSRCPHCKVRINPDQLRVLINTMTRARRETVGAALHPFAAPAETYSTRTAAACPKCEFGLSLNNVIQLAFGFPASVQRSLRASINSTLRRTFNSGGGRPRDESAERCPCGKNTMARAILRRFDCCRKAGVKVNRPAVSIGRPIGTTSPRCPCGNSTLAAAQRSDYKCCRKAGVVDDTGLILEQTAEGQTA
jgi:hypothetical protein